MGSAATSAVPVAAVVVSVVTASYVAHWNERRG